MALTPQEQAELDALNQEEAVLSKLTPDEQNEYLQLKAEEQIALQAQPGQQQMAENQQRNDAAMVGLEKGVTFGARPAIAGAGAYLGNLVGNIQQGLPLGEALSGAKQSYGEARDAALAEQEALAKSNPVASTVGEIGGSILTAPLAAGKIINAFGRLIPAGKVAKAVTALAPAIESGAMYGVGTALGEGQNIPDALSSVAAGAISGGVTGAALKGVAGAGKLAMKGAKAIFPSNAAAKVAETVTGVPSSLIKEYAGDTLALDKIGKEHAKDFGEIVDKTKGEILKKIQDAKNTANANIKKVLENNEDLIGSKSIIQKLEAEKKLINDKLYPDDIKEITEMINKVKSMQKNSKGEILLKDAYDLKKYFQDVASGAYLKDGQIFSPGDKVSKAAKGAAKFVREYTHILDKGLAEADAQLSDLHKLESRMVKTILKSGLGANPESFLRSGSGENRRGMVALKRMTEIVNKGMKEGEPKVDFVSDARNLAAAKQFANAPIAPTDTTGKTVYRVGAGAALGALGALGLGEDVPQGALIGAALASPFALKKVIQASKISGAVINETLLKLTDPKVNSVVSRMTADYGIDLNTLRRRLRSELYGAQK